MGERTCIVTRQPGSAEKMIRFVAGPDGVVVPDLRARLPGRGAWVTGSAELVDRAARKGAFARALKQPVTVPDLLAEQTGELLERRALDALGLAAGAGSIVTGFTKVERGLGQGTLNQVLIAKDAAADSLRKMTAAAISAGLDATMVMQIFTNEQMSLALGLPNVIHAGITPGRASAHLEAAIARLTRYRDGTVNLVGAA